MLLDVVGGRLLACRAGFRAEQCLTNVVAALSAICWELPSAAV
jgi:hypothetical protein